MKKILIVFASLIIGLTLVAVIIPMSDEAGLTLEEYSYNSDVMFTLDTFEAEYDNTFNIGNVQTIDYTDDDMYMVLGVDGATELRMYKWSEVVDDYVLLPSAITVASIGGDVRGVRFGADGELFVSSTGSPYLKHFYKTGDTWIASGLDFPTESNSVFDLDYYEHSSSRYLIYGGQGTFKLRVLKYIDDISGWTSNIFAVGGVNSVYDLDYKNDYIATAHINSPYLTIYKVVGEDISALTMTGNTLISDAYTINWNDSGDMLAVGMFDGTVKVFKFINENLIEVDLDIDPTLTFTRTVQFVGDNFLYVGGDSDIFKYQFNDTSGEMELMTNDLTTFTTSAYQIDVNNSYNHLALGDSNNVDCYITSYTSSGDPITLPLEPNEILSIFQDELEKDFTVDGSIVTIENPSPSEATINYNIGVEGNLTNLVNLFPVLAILVVISSVIIYIKFK